MQAPAPADLVTGLMVEVPTPDGLCDAFYAAPTTGRHPAVLIWPDIFGLRPAFQAMAHRLAGAGHAVLVVNPFYRQLRAPTAPQGTATPFAEVRPLRAALSPATLAVDAQALLDWLAQRPEVQPLARMGVVGYCMGGAMAVRTAALAPARIGAAASFHGGHLVTAEADSPHHGLARSQARFLIAVAANDDAQDPQAQHTLRDALAAAQRPGEVEVYPAAHGWCPPDSQVHDAQQAERAWQRLLALLTTARQMPQGPKTAARPEG